MNRKDEELKNSVALDERIAAEHEVAAQARPDAMHRAVRFLLHQAILNNIDIKREASHHLETLDKAMADAAMLEEIGEQPEQEPKAAPEGQTGKEKTPATPRQSRRFAGRS